MPTYLDTIPPTTSPWGTPQTAGEELPGVWHVTTAGHGGYILTDIRNAQIPERARRDDCCYEEDCDWATIAWAFRDEFIATDPAYPVERAKQILLDWLPEAYEAVTGEAPDPANSYALRRKKAIADAIGTSVIRSAISGQSRGLAKGEIIVTAAVVTGTSSFDLPRYDERSNTEWVIAEDDYDRERGIITPISAFPNARLFAGA